MKLQALLGWSLPMAFGAIAIACGSDDSSGTTDGGGDVADGAPGMDAVAPGMDAGFDASLPEAGFDASGDGATSDTFRPDVDTDGCIDPRFCRMNGILCGSAVNGCGVTVNCGSCPPMYHCCVDSCSLGTCM